MSIVAPGRFLCLRWPCCWKPMGRGSQADNPEHFPLGGECRSALPQQQMVIYATCASHPNTCLSLPGCPCSPLPRHWLMPPTNWPQPWAQLSLHSGSPHLASAWIPVFGTCLVFRLGLGFLTSCPHPMPCP